MTSEKRTQGKQLSYFCGFCGMGLVRSLITYTEGQLWPLALTLLTNKKSMEYSKTEWILPTPELDNCRWNQDQMQAASTAKVEE